MAYYKVISAFKIITASAVLLAHAFATCYSSIFFIKKFANTTQGVEIFNCAEHHSLGSYEQNLAQLKYFVENILTKEPMHLIIESKYFYNIDYHNTGLAQYFQGISTRLNLQGTYSYNNSPIDPMVTTWIAWELPLVLIALHQNEPLPFSIELTQDEKRYIKENTSAEFCDPRLLIKENYAHVKPLVHQKFHNTTSLSPTKLEGLSSQSITSLLKPTTNSQEQTAFCSELFDLEALSSIIKYVYYPQHNRKKKIVIISGYWHAENFNKCLPALNFVACPEKTGLDMGTIKRHNQSLDETNGSSSEISIPMASALCSMLGFIVDNTIRYKSTVHRKLFFDADDEMF